MLVAAWCRPESTMLCAAICHLESAKLCAAGCRQMSPRQRQVLCRRLPPGVARCRWVSPGVAGTSPGLVSSTDYSESWLPD